MRAARGTIEKSVPITRPSAHSPPVSCVWKAVAEATPNPMKMAGERPTTRAHLVRGPPGPGDLEGARQVGLRVAEGDAGKELEQPRDDAEEVVDAPGEG
eukprot:scaffold56366_cov62-Phaeocystis_antarctica.AAC.1